MPNDPLFDHLYGELRHLAENHLRRERADHTLQATALVHEAWIKLSAQDATAGHGRSHFLAVASQAMRRILVDHARGHGRLKRGDPKARVDLDVEWAAEGEAGTLDLVEVDDALNALAERSERQARIVEFRFFGGLSMQEIADVMDLSLTTVEREWRIARAWLLSRVGSE